MNYKANFRFKIVSSGSYVPGSCVTAKDLSEKMNVSEDWILKSTGVEKRYYAGDETIASMAAKAIKNALANSSVQMDEVTLLIAAGGTPDQPIPHNSALIHEELNLPKTVTPFDVNGTCLSFTHALMVAASFLESGMHKNIVIVSSEKPSIGLNYKWPESAALFGDGAVAFILTKTEENAGLVFSNFETYNEGAHLAEIKAGGTRFHPKSLDSVRSEDFLFKMEGQKIYKMASLYLPEFFFNSMMNNKIKLDDVKMVIPHQASLLALSLMKKKLDIPDDKFYINVHQYGNLVGASIPMSLHDLMISNKLGSEDMTLLLSTAAGLTLGIVGIIL